MASNCVRHSTVFHRINVATKINRKYLRFLYRDNKACMYSFWGGGGGSAIKSFNHETWNKQCKHLRHSLYIIKNLLYFLAPILTFKVSCHFALFFQQSINALRFSIVKYIMDNLHVRLTFNLGKANKIFYYS